jgi:chaperonin GroES
VVSRTAAARAQAQADAPEDVAAVDSTPSSPARLMLLAQTVGDLSSAMTAEALTTLGQKVVEDYEKDNGDRKEWREIAEEMLKAASQDSKGEDKSWPWASASNVNVPLLTVGALQFNARMYPAAIKGDEAILCKVIGQDNGVPKTAPNPNHGAIQPLPVLGPDGQPVLDEQGNLQIDWLIPPGSKAKRARRVSEYLNTTIFYRMDGWEADTDALLTQLPIIGCAFRKLWFDPEKGPQSAMVPALRLVVPQNIRSLESSPRVTEEVPDIYPHEIQCKQREGYYLDVDLGLIDEDKPRLLLEQHRWVDLDEDGYPEPYIVTVDKEQRQVLRVESNFAPSDIKWDNPAAPTKPVKITPGKFYVKYGFFPHPEGKFYDIGLGHLLKKVGAVIDTSLNQLIDAGNAQIAGGGFIASGLRLQGRAGRSVVKFAPGEYKTVDIAGDDVRKAIIDRTVPEVSPVTFQVLEFVLGFAKEIAGFKDVLTGETASTAPVGTTLALIEQGLQVFNAIAKRFFRSSREEYQLLFDKIRRYGGQLLAQDYLTVLDDPDADFARDFADADMDIRPVSDPSAITRMQKMAKAEYLKSNIGIVASVGGDVREVTRRVLEAADVEDIDKILPPQKPQPPDPAQIAQLNDLVAATGKKRAEADEINANAVLKTVEAQHKKYELEHQAMHDGAKAATI